MTRRSFATLSAAAAGAAVTHALTAGDIAANTVTANDVSGGSPDAQSAGPAAEDDKLQSEFLLDLILETQPPNIVGPLVVDRVIVSVSGGTFEGPKLKGTVVGPSGDWIVRRPDGSSVLDVRVMLQTDDAEKIYMTWRGISYTPQGGKQYARILPVFETGAPKYGWLNDIVAVGVYRRTPGKVAYRVYRIL